MSIFSSGTCIKFQKEPILYHDLDNLYIYIYEIIKYKHLNQALLKHKHKHIYLGDKFTIKNYMS